VTIGQWSEHYGGGYNRASTPERRKWRALQALQCRLHGIAQWLVCSKIGHDEKPKPDAPCNSAVSHQGPTRRGNNSLGSAVELLVANIGTARKRPPRRAISTALRVVRHDIGFGPLGLQIGHRHIDFGRQTEKLRVIG
jgi:hypothetical protein